MANRCFVGLITCLAGGSRRPHVRPAVLQTHCPDRSVQNRINTAMMRVCQAHLADRRAFFIQAARRECLIRSSYTIYYTDRR